MLCNRVRDFAIQCPGEMVLGNGIEPVPEPGGVETLIRDMKAVQAAFNSWHEESGLSYRQMSAVMARSIGQNRSAE